MSSNTRRTQRPAMVEKVIIRDIYSPVYVKSQRFTDRVTLHKGSFQLRVISRLLWFCTAILCDWIENLAPLSRPIRSKPKPIVTRSHAFSRA